MNTSRENYDADYETSRIQVFISKFKENKRKEKDNKIKELEEEIKKLKLQLTLRKQDRYLLCEVQKKY